MTKQIQLNSISHTSIADNLQAQTSSSTTSWPYSSTPVTGSYGKLEREVEDLWEEMMVDFRQGNYAGALAKAEHFEGLCDNFVERLEFVVEHYIKAQFAEGRAYFLALMQKKEALALCDQGFDTLHEGLDEFLTLAHECRWGKRHREFLKTKEDLQNTHLIYRGFIELSLGQREQAIADLKSGITCDEGDIETGLFYKVLEQKLGTTLLPAHMSVDPTNARALFWAGRYEEALALIPEHSAEPPEPHFGWDWVQQRSKESKDEALRGACLTLLGRTSEALLIFDKDSKGLFGFDSEMMATLTHLHKGNFAEVKRGCITSDQTQFLIPMPALCLDNRDFLRHLLPLAIRGFEN
jgi:tetratricopeptide (TPR) repeat protein